jgi:hypothetical protein
LTPKKTEKKRKEKKQPKWLAVGGLCRGYNRTDFFMMVKYRSMKELVWANLIEL